MSFYQLTYLIWCVQKLIPTQHRSIIECIAAMFPPILGDYFRIGTSITLWFSSSGSFIRIYNHVSQVVGFLIVMCNHDSQISKKWFWSALYFYFPLLVALVTNHPKRDLSFGGNNLLENSQNRRKSSRKPDLHLTNSFLGVWLDFGKNFKNLWKNILLLTSLGASSPQKKKGWFWCLTVVLQMNDE
jgi:hypothetical protein